MENLSKDRKNSNLKCIRKSAIKIFDLSLQAKKQLIFIQDALGWSNESARDDVNVNKLNHTDPVHES